MGKIKVARKSVSLDMTAMCDVAFLLLTFFMLTTKMKDDEAIVVTTPSSIAEIPIPDTDILLIQIDNKGKIYFGADRQGTRSQMLKTMGEKYKVTFEESELAKFANISTFAIPMAQMKQFLSLDKNSRNKLTQPGIPADSANNELKDWVYSARLANQQIYKKPMKIAIKGDQDSNAPIVQKVIATLQEQKINKFNFITNLEEPPAGLVNRKSQF